MKKSLKLFVIAIFAKIIFIQSESVVLASSEEILGSNPLFAQMDEAYRELFANDTISNFTSTAYKDAVTSATIVSGLAIIGTTAIFMNAVGSLGDRWNILNVIVNGGSVVIVSTAAILGGINLNLEGNDPDLAKAFAALVIAGIATSATQTAFFFKDGWDLFRHPLLAGRKVPVPLLLGKVKGLSLTKTAVTDANQQGQGQQAEDQIVDAAVAAEEDAVIEHIEQDLAYDPMARKITGCMCRFIRRVRSLPPPQLKENVLILQGHSNEKILENYFAEEDVKELTEKIEELFTSLKEDRCNLCKVISNRNEIRGAQSQLETKWLIALLKTIGEDSLAAEIRGQQHAGAIEKALHTLYNPALSRAEAKLGEHYVDAIKEDRPAVISIHGFLCIIGAAMIVSRAPGVVKSLTANQ